MTRRLLGVALAWAVTMLTIGLGAAPAGAAAPRDQGWWTVTNPGAIPNAPVPVSVPGPPDVPSRGLLVQGGGGGAPTAFSALLFELDAGTTATTLTLAVASASVSTPATLQVCRLLSPINHPEQGGPMGDAPVYDCSHKVTATASANTYKFDVSGLLQDNMVAVAILPTGPVDRVVLNAPDDKSLATEGGSPTAAGSSAADTGFSGSEAALPSDVTADSTVGAGAVSVGSVPPVTVGESPIAAPAPAVSPRGPASAGALPFLPAATTTHDDATPLAVILLVVLTVVGAGLWTYAGQQRARPAVP